MVKIIKCNLFVIREEVSWEEVKCWIEEIKEFYKLEIFEDLEDLIIIYYFGEDWWDLCVGFYIESIK